MEEDCEEFGAIERRTTPARKPTDIPGVFILHSKVFPDQRGATTPVK